HPDESKHPLNTGRLAALGLQQSDLWVGEHFPQLNGLVASVASAYLLFPGKDPSLARSLAPLPTGESSLLVVPDGTWRNARRIVQVNPILSTLPHLTLPLGEPSQYRVRKAREPAAVSTIEAIMRSLSILEPDQDFKPLLKPFDVLVEQQIEAMGPEVYQRHHRS
ncbi:MAG TPA: DTW domain-containing protein, partial [Burkholderiaceae bacterium]|nr:DTW domain-containing protein [Burkholderiaceae bacterium]